MSDLPQSGDPDRYEIYADPTGRGSHDVTAHVRIDPKTHRIVPDPTFKAAAGRMARQLQEEMARASEVRAFEGDRAVYTSPEPEGPTLDLRQLVGLFGRLRPERQLADLVEAVTEAYGFDLEANQLVISAELAERYGLTLPNRPGDAILTSQHVQPDVFYLCRRPEPYRFLREDRRPAYTDDPLGLFPHRLHTR